METFNTKDYTHRRFNPLTGEWILVSPHRAKRPWQGQEEKTKEEQRPEYDPTCYLCPGNSRIGGESNPKYTEPYVFTNDFSAIVPDIPEGGVDDDLFLAKSERGICKVICFSPNHSLTLPEMELTDIEKVIRLWQNQCIELKKEPFINHIQIFENKGSVMGCSNPHPHCQIWAQESFPEIVKKEDENQKAYFDKNGKLMLEKYLEQELEKKERIVYENDSFVTLVPYWAVWPFEVMILPKTSKPSIMELTDKEVSDFADILKATTTKFDNLFEVSFPYSAGIHQNIGKLNDGSHWTWHMHFFPPLLRSATVKKFMVGYEMMGEPQRDITAEQSAALLRDLSTDHYKNK